MGALPQRPLGVPFSRRSRIDFYAQILKSRSEERKHVAKHTLGRIARRVPGIRLKHFNQPGCAAFTHADRRR